MSELLGGELGYWKFDEGAGSTTADSSSDSHNGAIIGASWSSSTPDRIRFENPHSLSFDGTDDYVSCGSALSVSGATQMSATAWVFPTLPGVTVNRRGVVSQSLPGSSSYVFQMGMDNADRWRVRLYHGDALQDGVNYIFGSIALNQWTLIGFAWDGSVVRTYQDGVLQSASARTQALNNATRETQIGRMQGATNQFGYFGGLIDDVRIFGRGITDAEMTKLWEGGPAGNVAAARRRLQAHRDMQRGGSWL